jgi:hypothetical protein
LSLNFKMLVLAGWFIYLAGLLVTTALYSYTLVSLLREMTKTYHFLFLRNEYAVNIVFYITDIEKHFFAS